MAARLLPAIDLTGEPTVWAFQDVQAYDGLARAWKRREGVVPRVGPAGVWRAKLSDLEAWDARNAFPEFVGRGGHRARLMVYGDDGRWQAKRIVGDV